VASDSDIQPELAVYAHLIASAYVATASAMLTSSGSVTGGSPRCHASEPGRQWIPLRWVVCASTRGRRQMTPSRFTRNAELSRTRWQRANAFWTELRRFRTSSMAATARGLRVFFRVCAILAAMFLIARNGAPACRMRAFLLFGLGHDIVPLRTPV
jgi:hypothetical protein